MLPGLAPSPIESLVPVTATYCGTAVSGTDTTALTFTGVAIDDGFIVVAVMHDDVGSGNNSAPIAVTVGGVPCWMLATTASPAVNAQVNTTFWMSDAPLSGATANIEVDFANTSDKCRVNTYVLSGPAIVYASGATPGDTSATIAGATVPAGGALIVACGVNDGSETPSITTSGITMTNDQNGNSQSMGTRSQHFNNTGAAVAGISFTHGTQGTIKNLLYMSLQGVD